MSKECEAFRKIFQIDNLPEILKAWLEYVGLVEGIVGKSPDKKNCITVFGESIPTPVVVYAIRENCKALCIVIEEMMGDDMKTVESVALKFGIPLPDTSKKVKFVCDAAKILTETTRKVSHERKEQ